MLQFLYKIHRKKSWFLNHKENWKLFIVRIRFLQLILKGHFWSQDFQGWRKRAGMKANNCLSLKIMKLITRNKSDRGNRKPQTSHYSVFWQVNLFPFLVKFTWDLSRITANTDSFIISKFLLLLLETVFAPHRLT